MEIKAKITKKIFQKDDFFIYGCVPVKNYPDLKLNNYGNFTIVGNLQFLTEGKEYVLELQEDKTTNYGTQYKVLAVPSLENMEFTDSNEYEFLCEITTPTQARYVNQAYPNFIRLVLNGDEDKIDVKNIYNVKKARFAFLIREINAKHKYFKIVSALREYEITMRECETIGQIYRTIEESVKQVKENPYYMLISVLGRGFKSADKLICTAQPDLKLSEQRTEFLILHILRENEFEGNSKMVARTMAEKSLEIAPECVHMLKTAAVNSPLIYYDEPTNDMAIMSTYLAECEIAQFVKEKIILSNALDYDWKKYQDIDGFKLTDEQLGLLDNFCKYNISLLVGSAGSGKTSCTTALIKMIEDEGLSYNLLCSTGKASKRLAQCTNRPTSTIHRLCFGAGEDGIWSDVILVDEFSMVDIATFCMLIRTISNHNCRIVLVGDDAQLQSVGEGNVFFDLINSNKIPTTKLTEVFRYKDNGSLFVATNIRKGIKYLNSDPVQKFGKNFVFMQSNNCFKDLISAYTGLIDKGISPNDILCLSPYNVGSEGTYAINNTIQSIINPPLPNEKNMSYKRSGTTITFRKGSRVLNKKNNYKAVSLQEYEAQFNFDDDNEDNFTSITIFNGDEGIVQEVRDDIMVIKFDDNLVVFTNDDLKDLVLSFCISIHASQGSESEYVISLSSPTHSRMLNRNLIYVSSTRSRCKHIEIGDIKTIDNALKIAGQHERNTFLLNLLTNN